MSEPQALGAAIDKLREKWIASGKLVCRGRAVPADEPPEASPVDGLPYCDACRGFRYVQVLTAEQLEAADRRDPRIGQIKPCEKCNGLRVQARMNRVWNGLPPRYRNANLDLCEPSQTPLVAKLSTWIDATLDDSEFLAWLYLWGKVGRGKTWLAVALLRIIMERDNVGIFVVVPDMLDKLRSQYHSREAFENDNEAMLLMESIRKADVVVFDDIGAEKDTDWTREKLFMLIGARYDAGKRCIFTANCDLGDLAIQLDHARTPSRIQEMTGGIWDIEVTGPNLRLPKAEAF